MTFINTFETADVSGLNFDGQNAAENTAELIKEVGRAEEDGRRFVMELERDGHLVADISRIMPDGARLIGNGTVWENTLTTETLELDASCFVFGSLSKHDAARATWTALGTMGAGQVPAVGNPGDILLVVESVPGFGSGATLPAFGQFFVIGERNHGLKKDIPAGTGAMGTDAEGAWYAQVGRGQLPSVSNLYPTPHMARDITVVDLKVKANHGQWFARSACIGLTLENIEIIQSTTAIYGNALVNSNIRGITGEFEDRAIEAAWLSDDTKITEFDLTHVTRVMTEHETPVRTGEWSQDMLVGDGSIDMAQANLKSGSDTLITSSKSRNDQFRNITVRGRPNFRSAISQGGETYNTGYDHLTFDCGDPIGRWWSLSGDNPTINQCRQIGDGLGIVVGLNSSFGGGTFTGNYFSKPGGIAYGSTAELVAVGNRGLNL